MGHQYLSDFQSDKDHNHEDNEFFFQRLQQERVRLRLRRSGGDPSNMHDAVAILA